MAYEAHIERKSNELITLEEWIEAVQKTEGVRLCSDESTCAVNPATNEQISSTHRPGTVEMYDHEDLTWNITFRWFQGRISTVINDDFNDFDNHHRSLMRLLATRLDGQIVGDEDEIYA